MSDWKEDDMDLLYLSPRESLTLSSSLQREEKGILL